MKKQLKLTMLIFLSVIITSCAFEPNTINYPKEIHEIVGIWKLENSQNFEIWHFNDSFFIGRVIKIEKTDTTVLENLRIFNNKTDIFYEATVLAQNNGLPVKFKLIRLEQNKFTFENKKHDFPKKIIYTFPDQKSLKVNVSGNDKKITFRFQKLK